MLFNGNISIKLARTLWHNIYRGQVFDSTETYWATLRIIPAIPLDREEVPENAPEVKPYVIVLVEDAVGLTSITLTKFEDSVSETLSSELSRLGLVSDFFQFFYPNLTTILDEEAAIPAQ